MLISVLILNKYYFLLCIYLYIYNKNNIIEDFKVILNIGHYIYYRRDELY